MDRIGRLYECSLNVMWARKWKTTVAPGWYPIRRVVLGKRVSVDLVILVGSEGVHGLFRHADHFLRIIAARTASGRSGACWQREQVDVRTDRRPVDQALAEMLRVYVDGSETETPVHTWAGSARLC